MFLHHPLRCSLRCSFTTPEMFLHYPSTRGSIPRNTRGDSLTHTSHTVLARPRGRHSDPPITTPPCHAHARAPPPGPGGLRYGQGQKHGRETASVPPLQPEAKKRDPEHEKTKLIPERRCSPRLAVAWAASPIRVCFALSN